MADHIHLSLFKVDSYIDGAWVTTENRFGVRNPADGEVIARVADGGAELAERRPSARRPRGPCPTGGRAPRPTAAGTAALVRATIMAHPGRTRPQSPKPWNRAKPWPRPRARSPTALVRGIVRRGASRSLDICATWTGAHRVKQPVGVVAAISRPWNFPSSMITRKAAPAWRVGYTFVLRPASETPLSAWRWFGWQEMAGFRGCNQHRHRSRCPRRPGVLESSVAKLPYRLDRGGQRADRPVRRHESSGCRGTGRQRALPGVRRCRSGCGRGRRHGEQVSQRRPDLRLRQPLPQGTARPGCRTPLRTSSSGQWSDCRWATGWRRWKSARSSTGGPCGGRGQTGLGLGHRRRRTGAGRPTAQPGRPVLPADRAQERDQHHARSPARRCPGRWRRSSPSTPRPRASP